MEAIFGLLDPKIGGKEGWIGLGWPKNEEIIGKSKWPTAGFHRPIWARLPASGREIWRGGSPSPGLARRSVRVTRRWPEKLKMGKNRERRRKRERERERTGEEREREGILSNKNK